MPTPLPDDAARALAHPLRSRLLAELRVGGPATATDLARALGTHSGATSYHLRQLAEVGLVEDTGAGQGRRREWQAVEREAAPAREDDDLDPDTAAALEWIERDYLQHFTDRSAQWLDQGHAWPQPWRDELGLRDAAVLVTREQLASLRTELDAVLDRYRRVGQGNPLARRVAVHTHAYPLDADRPPRQGA